MLINTKYSCLSFFFSKYVLFNLFFFLLGLLILFLEFDVLSCFFCSCKFQSLESYLKTQKTENSWLIVGNQLKNAYTHTCMHSYIHASMHSYIHTCYIHTWIVAYLLPLHFHNCFFDSLILLHFLPWFLG